jgi:hypothetical protein
LLDQSNTKLLSNNTCKYQYNFWDEKLYLKGGEGSMAILESFYGC